MRVDVASTAAVEVTKEWSGWRSSLPCRSPGLEVAAMTKPTRHRRHRHHPPAGHCYSTQRRRQVSPWRSRRARTSSTSSTMEAALDATHMEETWTSKMPRLVPERLTIQMVEVKAITARITSQRSPSVRIQTVIHNSDNCRMRSESTDSCQDLSKKKYFRVPENGVRTWGHTGGWNSVTLWEINENLYFATLKSEKEFLTNSDRPKSNNLPTKNS